VPTHIAADSDIRTDIPSYNVYENGKLVKTAKNIDSEWKEDSVAFFIGCSYSFESALIDANLVPRHIEVHRNVPMYKTKVPLCPAGVFGGRMVVSMRPYLRRDLERVRNTTRPFTLAHGEPVAWGYEGAEAIGITDIRAPEFGDPPEIRDDEIPVFWGCGVTPQLSIMDSGISGQVVCHAPGQMLVLDLQIADVRSA
ncbi:MAG: hypothetical protein CYPHOPRED_004342, partial [Cyphobasidiales sp. Tagirdzhanova-0007]